MSVLRPKWFKPLLGKFAQKSLLAGVFGLVLLLSVGSAIISQRHTNQQKKAASKTTPSPANGTAVWKDLPERAAKAPKSGPVQYEIITQLTPNKPLSGRIAIVTPEKTIARIIELNDNLLAKFKASKQITSSTQIFYLDYFEDKSTAKDYFVKQSNKNTTTKEKQELINHYVATMVYQTNLNLKFLTYIPTAQVAKRY